MTEPGSIDTLELMMGRVLGAGVKFSTTALAVGLASALMFGVGPIANALLVTGILLLIATPIARVLVSSMAFIRRRDWIFTALTLVVLGELVASIIAAVRSRL